MILNTNDLLKELIKTRRVFELQAILDKNNPRAASEIEDKKLRIPKDRRGP